MLPVAIWHTYPSHSSTLQNPHLSCVQRVDKSASGALPNRATMTSRPVRHGVAVATADHPAFAGTLGSTRIPGPIVEARVMRLM